MVIYMTRREGWRFVEEALFVKGYEAAENQWDIQPGLAGGSPQARIFRMKSSSSLPY